MIIDAHVNIDPRTQSLAGSLKSLRDAGVNRAFVFADAESPDLAADNVYMLQHAPAQDCYPFYYLGGNPFTDTRMDLEIPEDLELYAGLRWHGWFSESQDTTGRMDRHEIEFAVSIMESAEFEALVSALSHYDLPILFEEDFAVTVEFVARFGSLNIIIPHMGVFSGGEARVIGRFYNHPNVYFTTSYGSVGRALARRIGPDRLLFASDFPYASPRENIRKVEKLGLNEDDEALIFGDNAERLLGRRA